MGSIINSIGTLAGGGPNNSSYQGQMAPIQQATTTGQANQVNQQVQGGLGAQQQLAQALAAQGGIGNQSQVFNQQQQLAGALQQQAAGQGPNPAQTALNQNTGANVANQAALGAGQRGASSNVGLMQRQIGQQGAGIQQQAIGQGAQLQAQQQLAAQNALMQQQAQMANLATQQVGQQQGAANAYTQAGLGAQSNTLGAIGNQNQALTSGQNSINSVGGQLSGINAQNTANAIGGLTNAAGGALTKLFFDGGPVPEHYGHMASIYHPGHNFKSGGAVPGQAQVEGNSPKNDTVPAMLSPGEIVIDKETLNSPNPGEAAKKMVESILAKKGTSKDDFKAAIQHGKANRKK